MRTVYVKGWKRQTSKGGTLEIINRDKDFIYTVCSLCHSDKELFPLPIKTPTSGVSDLKTKDPCSCSGRYRWSEVQRFIQVKRVCDSIGYIFHGFLGKFAGNKTYLDLESPASGNRWDTCNIANFLNNKRRDPSDKTYLSTKEIPLEERLYKVEHLLSLEGIPQKIDPTTLQINNTQSHTKFVWYCKRGHKCETSFNNFINHGNRCGTCYKTVRSLDYGFRGFTDRYYAKYRDREDYLYVLQLENEVECFNKIGRTFNISQRMSAIRTKSPYTVTVLYLEKNSHFNIYSREKKLLNDTIDQLYVPSTPFGGWTEARRIESLENLLIDGQL